MAKEAKFLMVESRKLWRVLIGFCDSLALWSLV
jgi:hypothetical protein